MLCTLWMSLQAGKLLLVPTMSLLQGWDKAPSPPQLPNAPSIPPDAAGPHSIAFPWQRGCRRCSRVKSSWKGTVCALCTQACITHSAETHLPPPPPRPPRQLFMSSQVKADGARPNKAQVPRVSCLHFPSPLPGAAVPHSPMLGKGEETTSAICRALPAGW